MYRFACIIAAVLIFMPAALATTVTFVKDDNQTLVSNQEYTFRINNGKNIVEGGGLSPAGWGTHTFASSDYSFSLQDYNTATMTMVSATLDLAQLASSSFSFAWLVSPDPGDGGAWRPHWSGSLSSYTFLDISAPISAGGTGATYTTLLGPNTPLVAYDMMSLFATDLQANNDIVITWRQTFTETACFDGSCGGTAYNKNWPGVGGPDGLLYTMHSGGTLDTDVQATLTFSDGLAEVPEPATFLLFGGGLLALGLARRRFRRN